MLFESLWLPFALHCLRERWHKCFSTRVCRIVDFITSSPFINTFACDIILSPFFLLKQEWICRLGRKAGNYLSACLNCEKIFEKHGQPNRRLSPQASAGFEAAAKTVCKMFNFFESCNFGERNNGSVLHGIMMETLFRACCSRLCLLWARPNFARLTFERDIKMWLIEFQGNGHRKRWEWVRYCCQRRYHTLQIELDTK